VAWLFCVGSAALWAVLHFFDHPQMLDLSVYRAEGFAVRHGIDLYGPIGAPYGLRATYPPFAAMLFTVLTLVPTTVCTAAAGALNLGLLCGTVVLTRHIASDRQVRLDEVSVPLITGAAIWFEPVYMTLHYGQINLLILFLVLWDFSRPARARGRGIALGLAVALKLTPALIVGYLLVTRRFRFAATAAATAAAAAVLPLSIGVQQSVRFWTSLVFRTERVGNVANPVNQSLTGVLVRATHHLDLGTLGFVGTVAIAVIGLTSAVLAHRRHGEAWGHCAAGVTGLLVSPISWSHHWVWCVPIAVIFAARARAASRGAGVLLAALFAVFVSYLVWMFRSDQRANLQMSLGAQLISMPYVAFGVLFLFIAATVGTSRAVEAAEPAPLQSRPAGPPARRQQSRHGTLPRRAVRSAPLSVGSRGKNHREMGLR
jgi:alpha-1,2-mannosyltransferase